jgi:hypothetical protein
MVCVGTAELVGMHSDLVSSEYVADPHVNLHPRLS